MTDAELVARAREGDREAFGLLVDRHRVAVFRAALAALGSHADADDVAQDAFVMAFRRLGSFRGEASFKTWLLTIVWNQAANRRRSSGRWWRRLSSTAESPSGTPPEIADNGRSPEDALAAQQLQRAILAEVRGLRPRLKDALLLAQSGEYTYEEIAAMLRTPIGTIKWRVSEARRVIRERLRVRGYVDV